MSESSDHEECVVEGRITADGGLIGASIRRASVLVDDPAERGWVVALLVLAIARQGPMGQRSLLFLAEEDAAKFGVDPESSKAVAFEVEVNGKDGVLGRFMATVRGISRSKDALTVLTIDSTLGFLAVDGPEGVWSLRLPL